MQSNFSTSKNVEMHIVYANDYYHIAIDNKFNSIQCTDLDINIKQGSKFQYMTTKYT